MNCRTTLIAAILLTITAASTTGCARQHTRRLQCFDVSRHWSEQTLEFEWHPDVRVHINAPAEIDLDPCRPTELILYPLPNGNSIEWTIGRAKADGLDWHFYIQHIGAQTRRLREVIEDRNIIVAYLEAVPKSWPAWRHKHANNSDLIHHLVARIKRQIDMPDTTVTLSGHSGGGSFVFGYINGVERIPNEIKRIAFLDSNYGFSVEDGHGGKLLEWLNRTPDNRLVVLAYDDREITLDGRKVVGPTGGTYRATLRMLDYFHGRLELAESTFGECIRYRGINGRVDIIIHTNPDNRILHTGLVGDMSGYIHAITTGSELEDRAATFAGPVGYERWIQPD